MPHCCDAHLLGPVRAAVVHYVAAGLTNTRPHQFLCNRERIREILVNGAKLIILHCLKPGGLLKW